MFESVVTAVLNKFLGDYVANLEQNQLNLGIFSGTLAIEELAWQNSPAHVMMMVPCDRQCCIN